MLIMFVLGVEVEVEVDKKITIEKKKKIEEDG
jgi:hypothetical protein